MITQTFLSLALGLTLVAPMIGQEPPPRPHPGMQRGHGFGPMMMWGLDLTDAQKASMKAIATKHRESMKPTFEAAAGARKALRVAMMNPATPVDQLKALHDKASQVQFELALDRRAMHQETLALLTPEQKAKADKLRSEMQARHQDHPRGPEAMPHRGMSHDPGTRPEAPAKKVN